MQFRQLNEIKKLRKQVDKLTQVLAFYADDGNWHPEEFYSDFAGESFTSAVARDLGEYARETLKELKDE